MRIFIVEDDASLLKHLTTALTRYGYDVISCQNFSAVSDDFHHSQSHLVLLDVTLPYYDGFYWCKKIREFSNVPIIFLSSKDQVLDQVLGIEMGGDDYLTKPFSYDLLLAKIKSHLRRNFGEFSNGQEQILKIKQLTYYPERLLGEVSGKNISFSMKEGRLLQLLMQHYPKVCDRSEILNCLWDDEEFVDDNTLSVNITRLRKKLTELGINNPIQTVRGLGYALNLGDDQ